jgi:hypothetical protein
MDPNFFEGRRLLAPGGVLAKKYKTLHPLPAALESRA